MVAVRNGLAVNLVVLLALLAAVDVSAGIGGTAWGIGVTCGVAGTAAVARGLPAHGGQALGPADLVTLTRLSLSCAVAALVAEAFVVRQLTPPALVGLAAAALVLDAVDGQVARRTRTTSPFGARFDGEADAFLMLVLSVYVARSTALWVLTIGALRYLFALAGWVLPWLRAPLPPRYWRKVVAAVSGITLTFAAADIASRTATYALLTLALALLSESFGRDVWWLWRHRAPRAAPVSAEVAADRLPLP
jgi:phosphatidylglycerophosphate synthase